MGLTKKKKKQESNNRVLPQTQNVAVVTATVWVWQYIVGHEITIVGTYAIFVCV